MLINKMTLLKPHNLINDPESDDVIAHKIQDYNNLHAPPDFRFVLKDQTDLLADLPAKVHTGTPHLFH